MKIANYIDYESIDKFFVGAVVHVRTKNDVYTGRIKYIGEDCFDLDMSEQYDAKMMRFYIAEVEYMCHKGE